MRLWRELQQALRGQAHPALLDCSGDAFSGQELLQLVEAAAALLHAAPPLPFSVNGLRVCAVFLSNSAAYVVAVLAALRLRLAFMPLDPSWPPQRLQELCDEVQPASVVWAAAGTSGGHGAPAVTGWPLVELPALAGLHGQGGGEKQQQAPAAAAAGAAAAASAQRAQPPLAAAAAVSPAGEDASYPGQPGADDCCYLMFTSGSTGRPLAVCGTEPGVLNRCRWLQQACPFQADDRVTFKTAPTFVDSIWEVFGPLLAGVPLVAVPQAVARDPDQLLRMLAEQHISHFAAVPTLWRALAAAARQHSSVDAALHLRVAVSSGEVLVPALLAELQQVLPAGCRILNLYGSTEVAADCTAYDCTTWQPPPEPPSVAGQQGGEPPAGQQVPVGQPISGTVVAILACEPAGEDGAGPDSSSAGTTAAPAAAAGQRELLPAGSVGEVAVAGAGLAAGYLCRHPAAAAAQQQRFIEVTTVQLRAAFQGGRSVVAASDLPASLGERSTTPMFLTGDLGWLDAGGCLHLAGRRGLQVKIGGMRIDLAEVETALGQHPSVAAAAAKLWQLAAGPVLAAYVQLTPNVSTHSPSTDSLWEWCRQRLPAAAVPRHVVVLPQLPRSAAGKVQRSQLPHPMELRRRAEAPLAELSGPPSKRQRAASTAPAAAPAAAIQAAAAAAAGAPAAAAAPAPVWAPVSELQVSRAFARALGHSDFEATSNLFAIGGNSLQAAQIAGEVADGDVAAVFQHPTVRSLAAFLNTHAAAAAATEAAEGPAGAAAGGGASQQQQPAVQPPATAADLLAARRLDVSGGGSRGGSSGGVQPGAPADGLLQLAWRARMLQCVDAAPILEAAVSAAQKQPQHPQQQQRRVFACSHGGDVCCFDGGSGRQLWQVVLPDCTDAGLALCCTLAAGSSGGDEAFKHQGHQHQQHPEQEQQQQQQQQQQQYVAAAANSGTLIFLDASSGSVAGSVDCSGGIRAAPATDPWQGLVWQPTHGRQLVVVAAPGREVARLPLPAAVSAAVTFDAERRLALVCCLDGSLLAVAATQGDSRRGSNDLQLQVVWQRQFPAPLFVPAVPLPEGCVVAATVGGSVTGLSSRDGSKLWSTSVGGAVFAPLLALRLTPAAGQGQQQQQQQQQVLLVGTQAGQLAALDSGTGGQLATVELGDKVTGLAAVAVAGIASAAAQQGEQEHRQQLVVATLAPGIVALVDAIGMLEGGGRGGSGGSSACVLDAVRLPGDVFAAPAVGGGGAGGSGVQVTVGCRDDHLYCLSLVGPATSDL